MQTIEIPKELRGLVSAVLGAIRDRERSDEDEAHTDCKCPVCSVKDFKVPTAAAAGSDDALLALLNQLKDVHDATERRLTKAGKESLDLVLCPLSAEAEDIVLQLAVDTVAAAVRAEHALAALLPEGKRVPPDMLHTAPTLDKARTILREGRAGFQEKLDERKAAEQAKRDAKAAVDEALRAAGGT